MPMPMPSDWSEESVGRQDVLRLFAALARDFAAALQGEEPQPGGWPFAAFNDGLTVQRIIAAATAG